MYLLPVQAVEGFLRKAFHTWILAYLVLLLPLERRAEVMMRVYTELLTSSLVD